MSGLLAGKVWQSNLASHLKPLAAAMADIANDDGSSIFPSVAYMAWLLGKGRRSVQVGLSELRALGIIEAQGNDRGGRGQTTEYQMVEANLPKRISWKDLRKGAENARFQNEKSAESDTKERTSKHERAQPGAPDPSITVKEPLGKARPLSGLELLRDVARTFPPKESQVRYVSILGENPNEKLLRDCRAEWIDRGYNKVSWKWLTEWYAQGGIPERNGKPQATGKRFTKHGEEIIEETEDYLAVMGPDGTPTYRGKTAKGMAMHSNYPIEVFEQSFK